MIHFDEVKQLAIQYVKQRRKTGCSYYLIRDVFGRITLYFVGQEDTQGLHDGLECAVGRNWFAAVRNIEETNPLLDEIKRSAEKICDGVFYGERPLVKRVWSEFSDGKVKMDIGSRVITFYSYKGGVGRTTALALAALAMVREGKRVIAVDFDLEAPGLGTILKPDGGIEEPKYGTLDFMVEYDCYRDAIDIDDYVYPIAAKELTGLAGGELLVMQAANQQKDADEEYYNKLSRIDFNMPKFSGHDNPVENLIAMLDQKYHPDYILMDSRAGVHDIGGLMLLRYSDEAVPVFYGNEQNMIGLRFVLPKLVQADIPFYLVNSPVPVTDDEAEAEIETYLNSSWDCLQKAGYFGDDVPDANDKSSPYYPLNIRYDVTAANIGSKFRLAQLLDAGGNDNVYRKLAQILMSGEDMGKRDNPVNICDKRNMLESIERIMPTDTASAENEFDHYEDLKKNFYPLQEYRYIYDNSKFLITGSKGSGKTALFKVLQCPEYAKRLAKYLGNLSMEDIGRTEWVTGFDLGKEFPDRANIMAIGRSDDREVYFRYWKMLAIRVMRRYIEKYVDDLNQQFSFVRKIWDGEYRTFSSIMEEYGDIDERMSDVMRRLDQCLTEDRKILIITYDKLDSGLDQKYRGQMVSELLNFWSENNIRLKSIKAKIFLRNDIFKDEVKDITDKIKLNNYRANIEWNYDYLLAMVWKRIMERNEPLKKLLCEAIQNGGYFLASSDEVGIVPKPQREINQLCLEALIGNKMGKGNKAYTYNWISYRLSDTNEKIVPRSMLKLFSTAASKELGYLDNEISAGFSRIIRPRSMEDSLKDVSDDRLQDLSEEYPDFKNVFRNLKNYCQAFPADSETLSAALVQCGLDGSRVQVYVDQLKEIGVLKEYQRKKSDPIRYHIPDIYLKGMGLIRKGIR